MAENFHFMSRSKTYLASVSASGTGLNGNNPANAIDYKFKTYWENDDATPEITVDLNDANASIDAIWFKSDNVGLYRLEYSTDGVNFSTAFSAEPGATSGINFKIGFTKQTARFWRLGITGRQNPGQSIKVYELQLMEVLLTISGIDDMPSEFQRRFDDVGGGSYRAADGDLKVYEGLSEQGKAEIEIRFEFISKSIVDSLRNIWSGTLGSQPKKPIITLFPEPVQFPSDIFQAHWENEFDFSYSANSKTSGFSGSIKLTEV